MFQRIKDWWFENYIKRDIKKWKRGRLKQAAVHQTAIEANQKAFADLRGVVKETQVAEEVSNFYRGVDLGDGAGVQVFKGKTKMAAITAIVKAQRNTNVDLPNSQ
jgi:hypothetical protein